MGEPALKQVIIVDLDGTVSDSTHRSIYAQNKDWDRFHEEGINDPPHNEVVQLVQWLSKHPQHILLMITGRNEKYRQATLDWLLLYNVPIDHLLMRPDGDHTKDVDIKLMLLHDWLVDQELTMENVWFALEDRDRVVDGFREQGIITLQTKEPGY